MNGIRTLVCGGRDFTDLKLLERALDMLHQQRPFGLLLHGAARGADRLAGVWSARRGVMVREFPAEWLKHGRSAGCVRNQRMLDEGKPQLVVAFPGGKGTADMLARARRAGIDIVRVV